MNSPAHLLRFPLGRKRDEAAETFFAPSESELTDHMAIFGGTGQGKSKLLELLLRQFIANDRGFCLIDPHGDLAEDLLAAIAAALPRMPPSLGKYFLRRVHYLEPGGETLFSFDPFAYSPPANVQHPYRETRYHRWLWAKVEAVTKIIIRQQGEFDTKEKARLGRWMRCVLYAVGVATDDKGSHLSLGDAFALLDPGDRGQHADLYQRVAPSLPPRFRRFFEKLQETKRPLDQEQWVESTIGRLEAMLSPLVETIFSQQAPSVDFRSIVQSNGILLVNLKRTPEFSSEQGNAIGGLIIQQIYEAAETSDKEKRNQFYLLIDEASRFIGRDLSELLAQSRKWKLSVCLAVQGLNQLRDEQTDLTPDVLGICRTKFTFQQQYIPDARVLAESFFTPNLDFTKHRQPMDRPSGYQKDIVRGGSKTASEATGWGTDVGKTITDTQSHDQSRTKTRERSQSQAHTVEQSSNTSSTVGQTEGGGGGTSVSVSPLIQGNEVRDFIYLHGSQQHTERGSQGSETSGSARSEGRTYTTGGGVSESIGAADSRGRSVAVGETRKQNESHSDSEGRSWQEVLLAVTEEYWHQTPQLETSVEDQYHRATQIIRTLDRRETLISVGPHPGFVMEVAKVIDPFAGESDVRRRVSLRHLKATLHATHPYFFKPQLGDGSSPALPGGGGSDAPPTPTIFGV